MDLNLAGKTAIVTGGGSNIGRGIVLAFAMENSNVVVADIDEDQGKRVAEEANALGGKAIAVKTDVTDFDSVTAMVKVTAKHFKGVEILINNVGGAARLQTFLEKPRAKWEKEINRNLWAVLNCTKAVVDHMVEQRCGRIVNISSEAGRTRSEKVSVYAACKGGVITFTKALAQELGRYSINVNVVCPGLITPESPEHIGELSMWKGQTGQSLREYYEAELKSIPLGRVGKPNDIANAVIFLASDAASYITGQTLSVNGGWTMI